jgi:hypothetical protein
MTGTTSNSEEGRRSLDLLVTARDDCFAQVGNLDLSREVRAEFRQRHKQLTEIVDKLQLENFQRLTGDFKNSGQLKAENKVLSEKTVELSKAGKTLDNGAKALGILDQIIQIGTTFLGFV